MFKKIRKYRSLDQGERKLLNRSLIWLLYAFVLVRFIPLRWFSNLLGDFNQGPVSNDSDANEFDGEEQVRFIKMVKRSIRRIKNQLPWKVKCFEEAIAAKKVLQKLQIPTTLFLGVGKENERNLKAHAWLKAGETFITGERGYQKYSVVGCYS